MTSHLWITDPVYLNGAICHICERCGSKAHKTYDYEQFIIINSKNWDTDCDLEIIKQIDKL